MRRMRRPMLAAILAVVLGTGVAATPSAAQVATAIPVESSCHLNSIAGQIQHVVYLQFDNTHYLRDNSSIASDLQQMPHLLNFLTSNGTLFTNDHTILISHTAGGILSTMTGLYPDRQGITVSNSYFYQSPAKVPTFSSAFKYWTDLVDDSAGVKDALPNMVSDLQKTTPAPWVPYTRAGCDVGAVSLANIELENTGTGQFGDMSQAFGTGSLEWNDAFAANAAPAKLHFRPDVRQTAINGCHFGATVFLRYRFARGFLETQMRVEAMDAARLQRVFATNVIGNSLAAAAGVTRASLDTGVPPSLLTVPSHRKPSDPTVAVQERMDGLEAIMGHGGKNGVPALGLNVFAGSGAAIVFGRHLRQQSIPQSQRGIAEAR